MRAGGVACGEILTASTTDLDDWIGWATATQPLFHGFRGVDRMGNYNGNGKGLSTDFADDRG